MADHTPEFESKYQRLVGANVIPSGHNKDLVPEKVRKAIANLSDEELAALEKLSKETGSHITLSETDGGITVCAV